MIVDDASIDDSPRVAMSLADDRVLVIRLEEHSGISVARNVGMRACRSDWIAFLDADDLWPTDRTQQLLQLVEGSEPAMLFGQATEFVDGTGQLPIRRTGLSLQAGMFPMALARSVGYFDESLVYAANVDWIARALGMGFRVQKTDGTVLNRRVHGANMSSQAGEDRSDFLTIVRRHRGKVDLAPLMA